ncbi:hypothetical protein BD309DRAFT_652822 [Dichomitus squalens]|uniref:Uncharacterized protein n=1 Tax=Dichomitus squalens TaxID=114155 RepID=A0A4Q9NDD3_9APHY|nr:hypothetical protein BD309DRAFT_652822 [Dichomitus squalens]TBU58903.1 hypothetical protein BD310DRAFT_439124 [Dichomitus squalens]
MNTSKKMNRTTSTQPSMAYSLNALSTTPAALAEPVPAHHCQAWAGPRATVYCSSFPHQGIQSQFLPAFGLLREHRTGCTDTGTSTTPINTSDDHRAVHQLTNSKKVAAECFLGVSVKSIELKTYPFGYSRVVPA